MSESNKQNNENNKSSIYVLIIVFLVIIIGLLVTIIMLLNNDNKLTTNNIDTNNEIVENNKIEVNDSIKLELSNKINNLFSTYKSTTYEQSVTSTDYGFRYAILARELTATEKQFIVLNSVNYESIDSSRWQEVPTVKFAIDREMQYADGYVLKKEYGALSYDAVNKAYNELFGEELTNPVESVGKCPYIYYSSTTKEFYKFRAACGGTSGSVVAYYKDKFETTADGVDVYVNIGFIRYDEKSGNYFVYGDADIIPSQIDLSGTVKGKNIVGELTEGNQFSYKITETNKDKFSQYKFTFKKKDNYFYFEKVTKIN